MNDAKMAAAKLPAGRAGGSCSRCEAVKQSLARRETACDSRSLKPLAIRVNNRVPNLPMPTTRWYCHRFLI